MLVGGGPVLAFLVLFEVVFDKPPLLLEDEVLLPFFPPFLGDNILSFISAVALILVPLLLPKILSAAAVEAV